MSEEHKGRWPHKRAKRDIFELLLLLDVRLYPFAHTHTQKQLPLVHLNKFHLKYVQNSQCRHVATFFSSIRSMAGGWNDTKINVHRTQRAQEKKKV